MYCNRAGISQKLFAFYKTFADYNVTFSEIILPTKVINLDKSEKLLVNYNLILHFRKKLTVCFISLKSTVFYYYFFKHLRQRIILVGTSNFRGIFGSY